MKLYRIFLLIMIFLVLGTDTGISAPGDVTLKRNTGSTAYKPAVFPHWAHAIRFRCYVCHPAPFKMVKFKLEKGILKQDRGPYAKPEIKPQTDAVLSDEESKVPKKSPPGTDANEQPAPPAVPVIAVQKADETVEKIVETTGQSIASGAQDELMHGEGACGLCHNGKTAFLIEFKTCGKCHTK